MSIHPTLSSSLKNRKQRSVLKRIERIKYYISKGSFNEESPVFGLPKIKSLKIKVKKEKTAEKVPQAAGAPGTPPLTGGGAAGKTKAAGAPASKAAKGAAQAQPKK
jgi:small basic protein (TIGR04137 family)